jgi:hypothetical protein
VLYNNGIRIINNLSNGHVSQSIRTDESTGGNLTTWERITTTFQGNGDIGERETVFDNGLVHNYAIIHSGKLITWTDNSDNGSLRPWFSVETRYTVNGHISSTTITYDDDVTVKKNYREGVVEQVTQTDESIDGMARPWETFVYFPNSDGSIRRQVISYDDGRYVAQTNSEFGFICDFQIDESADGLAYAWSRINYNYDQNDRLTGKDTYWDDGRFTYNGYNSDGSWHSVAESYSAKDDAGNYIYNWENIVFYHDETGDLTSQHTTYWNRDLLVTGYDNQSIETKLFLDASDIRPWFAREYVYDANGNIIDTIFYDTFDDIP